SATGGWGCRSCRRPFLDARIEHLLDRHEADEVSEQDGVLLQVIDIDSVDRLRVGFEVFTKLADGLVEAGLMLADIHGNPIIHVHANLPITDARMAVGASGLRIR